MTESHRLLQQSLKSFEQSSKLNVDKLGHKLTPLLDFKFEEVEKAIYTVFQVGAEWRQVQVLGSRHLISSWNSNKDEFIGEMANKLNEINKECKITHIMGDWLNGIEISGRDKQLEGEYCLAVYYVQDKSTNDEVGL